MRCAPWIVAVAALASSAACTGPGKFVWADEYVEPAVREEPYALKPGDVIQMRVFTQDQLTSRARIREDGKVSLPLVSDVKAVGLTPTALAADIQERMKEFIKSPIVTISVEETRPHQVYVAGEVARPGVYPLESSSGVLQALVKAGGLAPTANDDRIFVLRNATQPSRIRFTYQGLVRPEGKAAAFRLRPDDVVVVE